MGPLDLGQTNDFYKGQFSTWIMLHSPPFGDSPLEEYSWTNRRIAHKWDSGWDFATFREKYEDGSYGLYYASCRRVSPHKLSLATYGADKLWLVIAKEAT